MKLKGGDNYAIGLDKYQLESYSEAILYFTLSIENDKNYDAFYYRGMAKSKLKDFEGALDDYSKAVELNPNTENNIVSRAKANYKLKLYKNAIEDYSRVIELNPNNSYYYRLRAESKLNLKQYSYALEDFNKAIQLNKNCWYSYSKLGLVKFLLNNYKEAILDLEMAIELNPNYQYARTKLKFIKMYFRNHTESYENFTKCDLEIKHNSKNTEAYFNRGFAKIYLNNLFSYETAIDDFKIGFENLYKENDDLQPQLIRYAENKIEYILVYLERKESYEAFFSFYDLCAKHSAFFYSYNSDYNSFAKFAINYLNAKLANNIANYNLETFDKINELSKLFKSYYYKRHYNLEYEEFNKSKPFIDYTKEELNISLLKVYKLDYNMGFGKYSGQSVSDLIKIDPEYFIFCIINLKHFTVTNDALVNKDLEKQLNYFEAIEINFHKINLITKKMKEEERLDEDRFHLNDEYFPDYDNM